MSFISKYSARLKAPLTSLLHTSSIVFAGPFPTNTRGTRFLLICMMHLTGFPLAYPISSTSASEIITFIKRHTIYLLGEPRLILSNSVPCSTASLLETFLSKYSIDWKTVMAYALLWNGPAEKTPRIIKSAIGRIARRKPSDWDYAVPCVLYGYRCRGLVLDFRLFSYLRNAFATTF